MASNKSTFGKIRDKLTSPQKKFAQQFADDFIVKVRDRTPYPPGFNPGSGKNVTGNLKRSWKADVSKSQVTIYNDAEYAAYVEDGTEKMVGAHMLKLTAAEAGIISKRAYDKVKKK